jgi:leucyl-tRNA synthetase
MVTKDGAKMSKSKKNVVDPDDMVEEYGADTLRLFTLFTSPPEKEFAWNEKGIEGCFRFLNRLWVFFQENMDLFRDGSVPAEGTKQGDEKVRGLRRKFHQTIKKVGDDIEQRYHLNTAVSSIMELFNHIKGENENLRESEEGKNILREALEKLVLLLSPFAPHICEELWERMGNKTLVIRAPWPSFDPGFAEEERVTVVVQVNGRLRSKFEAERDLPEEQIKDMALSLGRIQKLLKEKEIKKIIYIKNRLLNIVL